MCLHVVVILPSYAFFVSVWRNNSSDCERRIHWLSFSLNAMEG